MIEYKQTEEHRGRLQAQGGGLEESVAWSQSSPPTVENAVHMLKELKNKIGKKEAEIRKNEFVKAENFIREASANGGVFSVIKKSFRVNHTKDIRVDIEVLKGRAFVPENGEDTTG